MHDALADEVAARYAKTAIGPELAGAYGTSTELGAEVAVERYATSEANIPLLLGKLEQGAKIDVPALAFKPVSAGPLGGRMDCANQLIAGRSVELCFAVDSQVFTSITLYGRFTSSLALPLEFRAAVETRS